MAGERARLLLARVSVSYALLARNLVGSVSEDEASEYHAKGLATDEVLLFIAECGERVGNPSLGSLTERSRYNYYMEVAAATGYRGFIGIPVDSLAGLLLFMSALAEAELRGDDTVSGVRLRLTEELIDALVNTLRSSADPCMQSLAAALESVESEDLEVLRT